MKKTAPYLVYLSPLAFVPLVLLGPLGREQYSLWAGTIGLVLYVLTLLPSMIRRYGLHTGVGKPIIANLLPIRRELGILMFVFAFVHYLGIKILPTVLFGLSLTFPLYQIFGAVALTLTLPMFLTSNTWSTRMLKGAWKKLHRVTYVAGLAIFGHVVLVGISWQAVVIGVVMALELGSLVYAHFKK